MPYYAPQRQQLKPRGRLRGWARPRRSLYGLGQDPTMLDLNLPISSQQYAADAGMLDLSLPVDVTNPGGSLVSVAPFSDIAPSLNLPNTPSPSQTPAAIAALNNAVNAAVSPYSNGLPGSTLGTTGVSSNVLWVGLGLVAVMAVLGGVSGGKKKRR